MKIEEYILMNGTEQEILDLDLDSKIEASLKRQGAYYGKISIAKDFAKIPLKIRQKVLNVEFIFSGWGAPIVEDLSFTEQVSLAKNKHYTIFKNRSEDGRLRIHGPTSVTDAFSCLLENYYDKIYRYLAYVFFVSSTFIFVKNLVQYLSAYL